MPVRAIRAHHWHSNIRRIRQRLFGGARIAQQAALQLAIGVFAQTRRAPHPVGNGMIHVVATERRIAGRGQHLEHAAIQPQDRNVEGTAAQIVDCKHTFGTLVEAVGHGGGGRLVEQAQHIKAGETRGILGGLALGIVEIGWHSDHHTAEFAAQRGHGAVLEDSENIGRYLDRTALTSRRLNTRHGGCARAELIRQQVTETLHVFDATPHQTLHGGDCIQWVIRCRLKRRLAYLGVGVVPIVHDRRQQMPTLLVRQRVGNPAAHRGHERVGGTEVDTNREPVLVRRSGLAGFADLQQCHG